MSGELMNRTMVVAALVLALVGSGGHLAAAEYKNLKVLPEKSPAGSSAR